MPEGLWFTGVVMARAGYDGRLTAIHPYSATVLRTPVTQRSPVFAMLRRGEMRFETTGHKQVIRGVLSWMPDVKVLAVKSLHDRVCEKLEAGLRSQ